MDELSALPPDEPRKRPSRIRTSSLTVHARHAYLPPSPSSTAIDNRRESPLRRLSSPSPIPHHLSIHEIHAPTPQRHLLESSASQHWLHTPPHSPTSSRAASPVAGPHTTHRLINHMSFSSLHAQGVRPPSVIRHREKEGQGQATMGRRWIRWMNRRGLRLWVGPTAILASTLVKVCVGMGSYSGKGAPPMYGDYEAQRHWMELTIHLPVREWYTYDLQYWGLDYPPLTAYVSWVCGKIGSRIEPAWFALDTSRGIEAEGSKVFMRATVVVCDALVYVPALLMFARTWQGSRSKRTQSLALLTLLFQPALLLVDFGHFQYNSVMLGLTLFALNFFATGQDLVGAVCFVLSLGFKQMSLYYAPAIGSYLLAKCIYLGPSQGGTLFIRLAAVTTATFLLLFLPFLPPFAPPRAILDPITRIFPFARGLFEDKVANFWCASNVLFKWKNWVSTGTLVKLSAGLTALGFLPGVGVMLHAGYKLRVTTTTTTTTTDTTDNKAGIKPAAHAPFLPLLPYALLSSSMAFFLFSFQVHEKTVLLPLLPMTLLLSGAHGDSTVFEWGVLVNNVAVFSMWPLLKRDGLGVQYIATLVLWNRLIGYNPFRLLKQSFVQLLSAAVYTVALVLHVLEMVFAPPTRYPDVYPVLNVLVCTPVFVLTWLWSIKCGIEVGWALGGLGGPGAVKAERRPSVSDGVPVSAEAAGVGVGVGVGVAGSFRQMGGRTVSLGVGQSRRRVPFAGGSSTSRASSVVGAGE